PGRTREPYEIAARLERQETVRCMQLRIVMIGHDEQQSLEDRCRVRGIFREVVEEANSLLVLERREEGEQPFQVFGCQTSKERSGTLLGCGSGDGATLMGNRDLQQRSCLSTISSLSARVLRS